MSVSAPPSTPSAPSAPSASRPAGVAGLGFTLLLVLAAAAFPSGSGDSAADDPGFLAGHPTTVALQALVRCAAALGLVLLAVGLGSAVRSAGASVLGTVATAAGTATGALLALAQAFPLAATAADAPAAVVRTLGALQESCLDVSSFPAALLYGAVGLAGLRLGAVPIWFAIVSLLGVPVALLDAASSLPALAQFGVLGLVYQLGWTAVAGVLLLLRR